jgi:hypothetical protein
MRRVTKKHGGNTKIKNVSCRRNHLPRLRIQKQQKLSLGFFPPQHFTTTPEKKEYEE